MQEQHKDTFNFNFSGLTIKDNKKKPKQKPKKKKPKIEENEIDEENRQKIKIQKNQKYKKIYKETLETEVHYSKLVNFKIEDVKTENLDYTTTDLSEIKRKNFAYCASKNGIIFIFGGETFEGKKLNDLIFYEDSEWYSIEFNEKGVHPPYMKNPFMWTSGENLHLFDCENLFEYYTLQEFTGDEKRWRKRFFDLDDINDFEIYENLFKNLKNVTPVIHSSGVYIFGGMLDEGLVSNIMIKILFKYTFKIEIFDPYEKRKRIGAQFAESIIPDARYNYSCFKMNDYIYYFGGQNGNRYFNDFLIFDTVNELFESVFTSQSLPPLINAKMFSHKFEEQDPEQYFYIFGGMNQKMEMQNVIYAFDCKNDKLTILNTPEKLKSFIDPIIISSAKETLFIEGEKGIFVTRHKFQNSENKKYFELLLTRLEETDLFDFKFKVYDEKDNDFKEIQVHKAFVSIRCSYLKELIENRKNELYEISPTLFEKYVGFLYTGKLELNENEMKSLLVFTKKSKENFTFLDVIFKTNVNLSSQNLFVKKFQSDLRKLMTDENHSDVKIQLVNDETGEMMKEYNLHKLFLFRSKHIKNIFKSGMKESIENTIEFFGITVEIFEIIIQYLYTNEIQDINLGNVIEILVHCEVFQLKEIINYSLNIVKYNVSVDNVMDIINFSLIYEYASLIDYCIRFCFLHDLYLEDEIISNFPISTRATYLALEKKKIRKKNKLRSQLIEKSTQDLMLKSLRKIDKNNLSRFTYKRK
eukprot:gene11212-4034_t